MDLPQMDRKCVFSSEWLAAIGFGAIHLGSVHAPVERHDVFAMAGLIREGLGTPRVRAWKTPSHLTAMPLREVLPVQVVYPRELVLTGPRDTVVQATNRQRRCVRGTRRGL